MRKERPRIAVIGACAIGGVTAGLLARAGQDVEIVYKHQMLSFLLHG